MANSPHMKAAVSSVVSDLDSLKVKIIDLQEISRDDSMQYRNLAIIRELIDLSTKIGNCIVDDLFTKKS